MSGQTARCRARYSASLAGSTWRVKQTRGTSAGQPLGHESAGMGGQVAPVVPQVAPQRQHRRELGTDHGRREALEGHRPGIPDLADRPEELVEVHVPGAEVPAVRLADVQVAEPLAGLPN